MASLSTNCFQSWANSPFHSDDRAKRLVWSSPTTSLQTWRHSMDGMQLSKYQGGSLLFCNKQSHLWIVLLQFMSTLFLPHSVAYILSTTVSLFASSSSLAIELISCQVQVTCQCQCCITSGSPFNYLQPVFVADVNYGHIT